MTTHLSWTLLILGQLALISSCANHSMANVSPGTDLSKSKSIYVVKHSRDKHGIDLLIREYLVKRGNTVTGGAELPASDYRTDIVATYQDRWAWDIVPYMIQLNITFRVPENGFPMASGNSLHTSLTRKTAEGMVDEVLSSIFDNKP